MKLTRRTFLALAAVGASRPDWLRGDTTNTDTTSPQPSAPRLRAIEHRGLFMDRCELPGETRAEDVFPAHPNGLQVARDRWLLLIATRGFRTVDDDRSIVYQLRRDSPDGPVIREGMLTRSVEDWDPLHDGSRHIRQHGHPVGFGVPRDALVAGKPAPHANVFVIKWRVVALRRDPATGLPHHDHTLLRQTAGVEWTQVRLNDQGDDIETVVPPERMRQRGYETGEAFCGLGPVGWMNQTFVQAAPLNAEATEWLDCNHFADGKVAPLRYAFDAADGRYHWVETGPPLFDRAASEASVARWGSDWVIAARHGPLGSEDEGGVAWLRTADPFRPEAGPQYGYLPPTVVPRTAYVCADGVLRLFSGDPAASPYDDTRNPLYMWDVDPDRDFTVSNRRIVFDALDAGLGRGGDFMVGMCKLLAPCGDRQLLLHRVAPRVYDPDLADADKLRCGVYHAWLHYDGDIDPPWQFLMTLPD